MTENKSIIINGVDVSGCSWYTQGATGMICADWHISNDCSKNPNCNYKQLKRKEQECEELKQTLKEIEEMCSEINCESLMENSWCGNTDFKMGCCEKFFKRQILQVIRESEIKHES